MPDSRVAAAPVRLEVCDNRFRPLVQANALLETLGEGFGWLEGPVWFADHRRLYVSDLPADRILAWSEGAGWARRWWGWRTQGVTGRSRQFLTIGNVKKVEDTAASQQERHGRHALRITIIGADLRRRVIVYERRGSDDDGHNMYSLGRD